MAGEKAPTLSGFAIEGPRIDDVPNLLKQRANVLYRVELTENQVDYLHDLLSVDAGDGAEGLSSTEFDDLIALFQYHHSGIHGPNG